CDATPFHTAHQLAQPRYSGFGVSGSILIGIAPGLSLSGWARSDNRLRAKVADTTSALTDLPRGVGGGVLLAPSPSVKIGGSVAWRSWSRAGPGAFDTWSWGVERNSGRDGCRCGSVCGAASCRSDPGHRRSPRSPRLQGRDARSPRVAPRWTSVSSGWS